jgi:ornithine cyclodeaminase
MTPGVLLLLDEDVRSALTPGLAVDAAASALVDAYRERLAAPPRLHADLDDISITFTAGGYPKGSVGFRAYGTWPEDADQLVVVWDEDGRIDGIVVGWELGARRTGALGGAAARALAPVGPCRVAVIGSGRQAWTQLWALSAVRDVEDVAVFSPHPAHRDAFASRAVDELELPARSTGSAEDATRDATVVILATRATQPVIDAGWIDAGTHVTTVGPKLASAHETPLGLVERASIVASDSPQQASSFGEPFFTDRPLTHLGGILAGTERGRTRTDEITLYCSTGLAGSEVVIAQRLLQARRSQGPPS